MEKRIREKSRRGQRISQNVNILLEERLTLGQKLAEMQRRQIALLEQPIETLRTMRASA